MFHLSFSKFVKARHDMLRSYFVDTRPKKLPTLPITLSHVAFNQCPYLKAEHGVLYLFWETWWNQMRFLGFPLLKKTWMAPTLFKDSLWSCYLAVSTNLPSSLIFWLTWPFFDAPGQLSYCCCYLFFQLLLLFLFSIELLLLFLLLQG